MIRRVVLSILSSFELYGDDRTIGNNDVADALFRGSGQCLDIFYGGENNDEPHLTACGNFSGQQWMVVLDGQCRLTTKFHGDGMCLDVFSSGPKVDQPHLSSCGNFSGQHWQLSPAKPAPAPAK
jgi:hypothetical protein